MAKPLKKQLAELLRQEADAAFSERSNLDWLSQQIARFCIPRDATFTEELSPGVDRVRGILDSTAPRSLELFASFIWTLLNNPFLQWFKLSTEDPKANQSTAVKQWADEESPKLLAWMTHPKSGLYNHLFTRWLTAGAYGTTPGTAILDRRTGRPIFQAPHLGKVAVDEDASGNLDVHHYKRKFTPRQAKQRFGADNLELGKSITDAKGQELRRPVEFQWSVFPTDDPQLGEYLPAKVKNLDSPFVSVWVNRQDETVVEITPEWDDGPWITGRWYKASDEVYGRSPSMTMLPWIRLVNRATDTFVRSAEKLADPPMMLPDAGLLSPVRLFPGGITYTEMDFEPRFLIPPGGSRIEFTEAQIARWQDGIREGYFVPFFMNPQAMEKVFTATQVLQNADERNRAASPMLVRAEEEVLAKLILRCYGMAVRAGVVLPPPVAREARVDFLSPLNASQKQLEALGLLRLYEQLVPWAQIDPGVFDLFNGDEVSRIIQEGTGAPAAILQPRGKVLELRKTREERKQIEEGGAMMIQGLEAAAKLQAAQAKVA